MSQEPKTYEVAEPESIGRGTGKGKGTLKEFKRRVQALWKRKCDPLKFKRTQSDRVESDEL